VDPGGLIVPLNLVFWLYVSTLKCRENHESGLKSGDFVDPGRLGVPLKFDFRHDTLVSTLKCREITNLGSNLNLSGLFGLCGPRCPTKIRFSAGFKSVFLTKLVMHLFGNESRSCSASFVVF
jgi:hypothetical protein